MWHYYVVKSRFNTSSLHHQALITCVRSLYGIQYSIHKPVDLCKSKLSGHNSILHHQTLITCMRSLYWIQYPIHNTSRYVKKTNPVTTRLNQQDSEDPSIWRKLTVITFFNRTRQSTLPLFTAFNEVYCEVQVIHLSGKCVWLLESDQTESGSLLVDFCFTLSTLAHTSLLISGGAIHDKKHKPSTLGDFRHPVIHRHVWFSSESWYLASGDLARNGVVYSVAVYLNTKVVVLMVLGFDHDAKIM